MTHRRINSIAATAHRLRKLVGPLCRLGQLVVWLGFVALATAQEPGLTTGGDEFFEKKIRPVLIARCYECHSEDSVESELRVDSLAHLLRGGTRGPAIVRGKPDESLLISALRHGELLKMPPKEKLSRSVIADFEAWVSLDAPWPNAETLPPLDEGSRDLTSELTEVERGFWSFQPLVRSALPSVRQPDWVQSPVDAFILAQLEHVGFPPAPQADPRTLIRRVTLDLTGLPPAPEEVEAFVNDTSPVAWPRLIERLLASPRYGERWGRHWLDVARYADSNGLDENLAYAHAYRYRDYVIAAFNKDKPFDAFVQEQIAGDLLAELAPSLSTDSSLEQSPSHHGRDWDTPHEGLVATGFLSLGAKMLAEDDPVKMQMDIIDEQVDTLSQAFMGLTFGCARCHDHKFDPLRQADYYALAGIFKSTKTMENFQVVARWQERPLVSAEALRAADEHQQRIDSKRAEIDALRKTATELVLEEARPHIATYLLATWQYDQVQRLLAQATVFGNNLESQTPPGALLLEAEDFPRGNVIRDTTNYGQDIGVLVNRGETPNFVEYDVELPRAGAYQFELRLAAANTRPCKLIIDGSLAKPNAAAQVTGSWFPDTQTWFVEGIYSLAAGKHVIRLEQPQFFPHIDKLLIVPVASGSPQLASTNTDQTYQPLPEFVRQWSEYLQQDRQRADTPLADWHAAVATGSVDALADVASRYESQEGAPGNEADKQRLATLRAIVQDPTGPFRVPETIENHFAAATRDQLVAWRDEMKSLEAAKPEFPTAMAVSEGAVEDLRIHIRGSHLTLGRVVPRDFPLILREASASSLPTDRSGRWELARWLTDSRHPLTPRVIANRVWLWHFGEGLVRSPDNFGRLGQPPSHPELLDWLANHLVESGWSLKELHRTILLSSTYQMSTTWNAEAAAVDPENRWYWRFNRQRLQAEAVRDALLAVSGQLDQRMGGSLLPTENRKYVTSTANVDPVAYRANCRSVYLPVVRSALYDVFQAFDFAEPSVTQGQRQATTVAPQALFMMNSQFVSEQTRPLAESLLSETSLDDVDRVDILYQRAYSRSPTDHEVTRALQFIAEYTRAVDESESLNHESASKLAWQAFCRIVLSANEFMFVE